MPNHTPKYFRSYSPDHRVKFINSATGEDIIDASNDLISLTTNKVYGRCSGTWQLMLTYKTVTGANGKLGRYDELIMPDDMITIELDAGDGNGMKAVMLGLVDRVSEVFQGGINPQRQIKISGQDMGKLLSRHDVGWDIAAYNKGINALQTTESGDSDTKKIDMQLNRQFDVSLTVKTAPDLIDKLFQKTFLDVLPKWASMFKLNITTKDDWILWNPAIVTLKGCTVWAMLTKCMHEPFNTLSTETLDTKSFQVTLEEQPIDDNGQLKRDSSRKHTIFESDIISDDVGVSDAERINFIFYQPQNYLMGAGMTVDVAMAHPDLIQYYEPSIETHGYCPKTVQDDFVPPNTTTLGPVKVANTWFDDARKMKDLLWSWYQFNHTYKSGTFHVHLRPDIKAGDGLIHNNGTEKKKEYFIEQVVNQYTVWPQAQFITTLSVTRGQDYVG